MDDLENLGSSTGNSSDERRGANGRYVWYTLLEYRRIGYRQKEYGWSGRITFGQQRKRLGDVASVEAKGDLSDI